jgi:HTH-type transcriptional regulator/antitoxin MqsA
MQCPTCGDGELIHDTRDMPYTYKGESTVLPQVTGEYCTACDEAILGVPESKRTMDLMLEFNKQVNGASKRAATQ